jgi:hypothetical protein
MSTQKNSKSNLNAKLKQKAWTFCEKCQIHYILDKNDQAQHLCSSNIDDLVVSNNNDFRQDFLLKNHQIAYLSLLEHPKGTKIYPNRTYFP